MSYVYPKLEIENVYIGDILGFLNLRILWLMDKYYVEEINK